jgi:hypothetical protein
VVEHTSFRAYGILHSSFLADINNQALKHAPSNGLEQSPSHSRQRKAAMAIFGTFDKVSSARLRRPLFNMQEPRDHGFLWNWCCTLRLDVHSMSNCVARQKPRLNRIACQGLPLQSSM